MKCGFLALFHPLLCCTDDGYLFCKLVCSYKSPHWISSILFFSPLLNCPLCSSWREILVLHQFWGHLWLAYSESMEKSSSSWLGSPALFTLSDFLWWSFQATIPPCLCSLEGSLWMSSLVIKLTCLKPQKVNWQYSHLHTSHNHSRECYQSGNGFTWAKIWPWHSPQCSATQCRWPLLTNWNWHGK